jgi:hypothetical protein
VGGSYYYGGRPRHDNTCCRSLCLGGYYGVGYHRSLCQGCGRLGRPDGEGGLGEGVESGG